MKEAAMLLVEIRPAWFLLAFFPAVFIAELIAYGTLYNRGGIVAFAVFAFLVGVAFGKAFRVHEGGEG